ncbi:ATP-binding cassette domain-containing protein [Actinomyces capricornis]|nr:ATP-binding cassette domain-containing protein [Actinomyces capricornis]
MKTSQHPVVRSTGLSKRYGAAEVVSGVGLEVPAGQVYGFLGPNGAGKSTTMKMLLGLTRPTAGNVEIFGEPFSPGRTLARVGSLIEQPSFYGHLTGRENLDIVRRVKHLGAASIDQALNTVGLSYAADKQARAYSLGMKQRLGLAMALLGEPELLILDEPTNGLDPSGIHEIRELITSLPTTRGITVMVSSHLLSEIEQMADTIGIISRGHLVYQGPLSALAEAGRIVVRIRPDQTAPAAQALTAQGWQVNSVQDGEITMPAYDDNHVARLVAALVTTGASIYRVELRRRSLEQIFLDITEQAPPHGQASAPQQPLPGTPHQRADARQAPVQRQGLSPQASASVHTGTRGPHRQPWQTPQPPAAPARRAAFQAPAAQPPSQARPTPARPVPTYAQPAYQGWRGVGA